MWAPQSRKIADNPRVTGMLTKHAACMSGRKRNTHTTVTVDAGVAAGAGAGTVAGL